MSTSEFQHYLGCNFRDPDNCSACALTDQRQERPNYAGWPLAYMENNRAVPKKWRKAFIEEMQRTDNHLYTNNLANKLADLGVVFVGDSTRRYRSLAEIVAREG